MLPAQISIYKFGQRAHGELRQLSRRLMLIRRSRTDLLYQHSSHAEVAARLDIAQRIANHNADFRARVGKIAKSLFEESG